MEEILVGGKLRIIPMNWCYLVYLVSGHDFCSIEILVIFLFPCSAKPAFHNWFSFKKLNKGGNMISLPEHMSVFAVQITTDFLSGGRRGTTLENRKNCCGRVTVALVRAIQFIYIFLPVDMSGLPGMA